MRALKIELGVCCMPGRVSASQQPLPTVLFLDTNLLCCSGLILALSVLSSEPPPKCWVVRLPSLSSLEFSGHYIQWAPPVVCYWSSFGRLLVSGKQMGCFLG